MPTTAPNDSDVSYLPLRAKLAYNFDAGEHVGLILGGGFVHTLYRRDRHVSDNGATGSAGIRLGLGDVTSIRIDTYLDYIPAPKNGASDNWNWGIQPGLSFMFGGLGEGKVRDKDGDGVSDKLDACPKTPTGEKVDAKGCTIKDSDGDGVLDDVDACATGSPLSASAPASRSPRTRRRLAGRRAVGRSLAAPIDVAQQHAGDRASLAPGVRACMYFSFDPIGGTCPRFRIGAPARQRPGW